MVHVSQILAVDDDPKNLEIISEIVENKFDLTMASSGQEALELIDQREFDIILLDIVLKDIDGYEVCKKIRSLKRHSPKIILVSGKSMIWEKLKGYEVGADDYLTKPFNDEEFLAKVNVFQRLVQVEKEIKRINSGLEEQINRRTQQLVEAQKMAFLGTHVAETVHNLKTPLTVIMASTNKLAREFPENKDVNRIEKACQKLHEIVKTTLNTNHAQKTPLDLNEILQLELEIIKAKPNYSDDIKMALSLTPLPTISGVGGHFIQIFNNLLSNAVDALYERPKKEISISSYVHNNMIQITIKDSGIGIPSTHLDKIFIPFFTTKPIETHDNSPTGTGLGLSSCKKMIEAYHGNLNVYSQEDEGTIFEISLPIANQQ